MAEPKPSKAPKAPAEKRLYTVLSPLMNGDTRLEEGEQVEMSDKQAAELVACGVLAAA